MGACTRPVRPLLVAAAGQVVNLPVRTVVFSAVILRSRFNPKTGRVGVVRYGIFIPNHFLNLKNASPCTITVNGKF